jgi:NAD(P)H-dependent flavin oxidoreductase YrpB (nitropropane dioxygenase family)
MLKFPKLRIADLMPEFPIIQGGMAVKVSSAKLAASVANEGGIGVIAGSTLTPEELTEEIKIARKLSNGIIGVNIMFAVSNFVELIKASIEAKIDLIISGAGFSRDMFSLGKKGNVPVLPIVSSLKLAKISEKLGAAAVVVEGGNAGGHVGTDKDSWDIVKEIKENLKIPVIVAGGIIDKMDIKKAFSLGVDGIQMGSRFLASEESSVANTFKELVVKAKEGDIISIISSVGLPANAIKTKFVELILKNKCPKPESCSKCLKACTQKFCIKKALNAAKEGDLENGLFFAGKDAWKINDILSVKEIFKRLFH